MGVPRLSLEKDGFGGVGAAARGLVGSALAGGIAQGGVKLPDDGAVAVLVAGVFGLCTDR